MVVRNLVKNSHLIKSISDAIWTPFRECLEYSRESYWKSYLRILRDNGRALLWVTTGHTGASLNPKH